MAAQLSIGGTNVIFIEDTLDGTFSLDERQRLQCDVIDYTGSLHFIKGEQVVLTDPVLGVMFNGYLHTDQEYPVYPVGAIRHTIDCIDQHYLADKRTYTHVYDAPQPAGKLVVDQLNGVLVPEGITPNFAQHTDTTVSDFAHGILSSTISTANVDDGNLELAPAGSDVSLTESTTTDFASGTLSNVTAANNTLTPTTQNALKFSVTLPISSTSNVPSFVYVKFWTGSMTVGVSDTLNFDVWIADSSPEKIGGVVPLFSDLTIPSGLYDQNGILNDRNADLSNYAVNQWYSRTISLSAYSGKTIIAVLAQSGGHSVGSYTWYIKNCYLGSQTGNKFFSPTATSPQLNPPQVYQYAKYIASTFATSVVITYNPANSYRISPSYSIDPVKLLKGSYLTWVASSSIIIYSSYNGGSSWIPCSINQPLPGLPAGSNVAGLSLLLKEVFGASDKGNDPTGIPVIESVSALLESAPNAAKSDIVTSFLTQTNWNTGTHSATQADVSGNLELAPYTRNWNDNTTTGQTSFFPSGTSQSVSSGIYTISTPANTLANPNVNGFGTSRLDFLSTMQDFTLDVDVKASNEFMEVGVTYRQIYWNGTFNNTFGYFVGMYPSGSTTGVVEIGYGSNSNSDSYTRLAAINTTISTNTLYHFKIVVNDSHHQVFFNNSTTPTLDVVDSTYTQAGGIGLRAFNSDPNASHTASWDNLTLAQQTSGTWTGSSASVSSLGTCGGSVITWMESGTSNQTQAYAFVQSSIDGGVTYQQCTNGSVIPGLSSGVSLASKSVRLQILLGTQTNMVPMVSGLVWRVLGVYPGSSGTRSTIPLGNDTLSRSNVVGSWGTAFDSQTYTKVGTGTTNLNSNEGQITNTTGDVHMVLGSRIWTDEDGTVRFSLSSSSITGGMELRYQDVNNFYRLAATTTTLSIIKKSTGTTTTLASTSISLSTGVFYWMRFRAVGNGPVNLSGRVWASGVLEPTTWNVTASV
jgi:hypothetical protein